MKATFKGKYEVTEKSSVASGIVTVVNSAGDLRLRTTATNATFTNGPSLDGLSVAIEKPGSFIFDFNIPKKDVRFQFMNTAKVMDKPISLAYTHFHLDKRTSLDCAISFDSSNKVSVSHPVGSRSCKIKYGYTHGETKNTIFEPCYDTGKNVWDFVVTRKFEGGDAIKGSYNCLSQILGLEWNRNSKTNGSFKISASLNMAEENKAPKLLAERSWSYDMF